MKSKHLVTLCTVLSLCYTSSSLAAQPFEGVIGAQYIYGKTHAVTAGVTLLTGAASAFVTYLAYGTSSHEQGEVAEWEKLCDALSQGATITHEDLPIISSHYYTTQENGTRTPYFPATSFEECTARLNDKIEHANTYTGVFVIGVFTLIQFTLAALNIAAIRQKLKLEKAK